MPRILKTPAAEQDLTSIATFIGRDSPEAAERLLDVFEEKFRLLSEFPGLGPARDELAEGLRSFPVGNYLIFYLPLRDGVDVVRVVHGARDLRRIFNSE